MDSKEQTGDGTAHRIDDLGVTDYEIRRVMSQIDQMDGVSNVERYSPDSGIIFVQLSNGKPLHTDDTPNPLDPDVSVRDFDVDGVRDALLVHSYRTDPASLAPKRLYMNDGMVEIAAVVHANSHDPPTDIAAPTARRGKTTLSATPSTKERVRAKIQALDKWGIKGTPSEGDVPNIVSEVTDHVRYAKESMVRSAVCDYFGFNPEEVPYGDFRDAPEEKRKEYRRKMARMATLHEEVADLLDGYDDHRAEEHRREAIDIGAGVLQFMDEEEMPDREEHV